MTPMKRQRLPKWIKKSDPSIDRLQETHFEYNHIGNVNVKGYKK